MSDSETPTLESLQAGLTAFEGDLNIFWLLFGAILVFCESFVPCVPLSRAFFVLSPGGLGRKKRTIYPTT